jgi:hypothetical protein
MMSGWLRMRLTAASCELLSKRCVMVLDGSDTSALSRSACMNLNVNFARRAKIGLGTMPASLEEFCKTLGHTG